MTGQNKKKIAFKFGINESRKVNQVEGSNFEIQKKERKHTEIILQSKNIFSVDSNRISKMSKVREHNKQV